jgi:hypothetical protein
MSVGFPSQFGFSSYHEPVAPPYIPQEVLVALGDLCSWINLDRVVARLWDLLAPIVRDASLFNCYEAVNAIALLRVLREQLGPKSFPLMERAMYSLHKHIGMTLTNLATVDDFVDYYQALDPSSVYSEILNEKEFRDKAYTNLRETIRSMEYDQYTKFVINVLTSPVPLQFKKDVVEIHKLLIKISQARIESDQAQVLAHTIAKFQISCTSKFNLPIPSHPTMDYIPYGYPPPPSFFDPGIVAFKP